MGNVGMKVCFVGCLIMNAVPVHGDDSWELNICGSICKPTRRAKIPNFCDNKEGRCTSCEEQCQYNGHIDQLDKKCQCFCENNYPQYGPYKLDFVCSSDDKEDLSLDSKETSSNDDSYINSGTWWPILGAVAGVFVPGLSLVVAYRRRSRHSIRPSDEESRKSDVSREQLLPRSSVHDPDESIAKGHYAALPSAQLHSPTHDNPMEEEDVTKAKNVFTNDTPTDHAGDVLPLNQEDYRDVQAGGHHQPVDTTVTQYEKEPNDKLLNPEYLVPEIPGTAGQVWHHQTVDPSVGQYEKEPNDKLLNPEYPGQEEHVTAVKEVRVWHHQVVDPSIGLHEKEPNDKLLNPEYPGSETPVTADKEMRVWHRQVVDPSAGQYEKEPNDKLLNPEYPGTEARVTTDEELTVCHYQVVDPTIGLHEKEPNDKLLNPEYLADEYLI